MPFVNGVFTRPSNSFSEPVEGTLIEPVAADQLFDDYDTGITIASMGLLNVKAYGATGDGTTDDSAAIQAAINAAIADNGGTVYFPRGDYFTGTTTLNLDNSRGVRLTGEGTSSSSGTQGSSITYNGTGSAVSARSSVGCCIENLLVFSYNAARVLDFRALVADTSSILIRRCSVLINDAGAATRICIDLNKTHNISIEDNTIAGRGCIDIQGVEDASGYSVSAHIKNNVFPNMVSGNAHIKSPGNCWVIENNSFETPASGTSIVKGFNTKTNTLTLISNFFGDGGVSTAPLVTTNAQNFVSIGNLYATSVGGGGSSTCIQMDNSSGSVTSIGDYLEADVGIDIGTGNYLSIINPNNAHLPTTLYSGTPANTNVQQVVGGPLTATGRITSGLAGSIAGAFRLLNNTSGSIDIVAPAGSALGTNTLTTPIATDTLLVAALAQNITNKTLNNTNIITARDDRFTLQDSGDNTKQAVFELSGITTATTRTYTVPDANGTLLYSGGPLGTPSSGVVTNLTGTASININGTVGATTRNTGAFTSVAANGGILNSSPTAGIGYSTGAGGSVTQITSRTTGVTLNTVSGSITMFTAAGSASTAAFTVTNSTVALTDTISLSVRGASNVYNVFVSSVVAGGFTIAFYSASGVASDTPIINFNVIKGVNS